MFCVFVFQNERKTEQHTNPAYEENDEKVSKKEIELEKDEQKEIETTADVNDDVVKEELDIASLTPEELALSKGLLMCIAYAATIGGTTTLTGTGTTVAMSGIIEE